VGLKRFDYKLKDNSKKKSIIVASIIVLVLIIGITIYSTYAAYKVTKTYNIIQGKVGEFVNADIKISVKTIDNDGNEATVSDFPNYLEYAYSADSSSCANGSTIEFDEGKWSATISSSGKDTCTLKFEQRSDKTLANAIKANTTIVEEEPDFSVAATDVNTNLYQAEDDLGTSYYFRGASTNNYVKFGTYAKDTTLTILDTNTWSNTTLQITAGTPMYWRIIRVNGDDSVRLIYDGTNLSANGSQHLASIGVSAYNDKTDQAKYVGYTYDDGYGTQVDSLAKSLVDNWYEANLKTNYETYITDGIFCNDRTSSVTQSGFVTYAPNDRLYKNEVPAPILTCTNKEDRYTVNDSTNGNALLKNPIGLLTADEAFLAGGSILDSNSSYYLNNVDIYYTMTPSVFSNTRGSVVWIVDESSRVDEYDDVRSQRNNRPVINLDANIKMYGSGTIEDPYRLTEEL